MNLGRFAITFGLALGLAATGVVVLLFVYATSIPTLILAAIFGGLIAFFFAVLQVGYGAYAIADGLLFPKQEKLKGRAYSIKQSKEAK
ncbi:hypothetical protein HZC08_02600 [Candidatus Micrarchaeota archaeon]|nr:hypothetical protein [Candidatus Micrarchaeota archaeon]